MVRGSCCTGHSERRWSPGAPAGGRPRSDENRVAADERVSGMALNTGPRQRRWSPAGEAALGRPRPVAQVAGGERREVRPAHLHHRGPVERTPHVQVAILAVPGPPARRPAGGSMSCPAAGAKYRSSKGTGMPFEVGSATIAGTRTLGAPGSVSGEPHVPVVRPRGFLKKVRESAPAIARGAPPAGPRAASRSLHGTAGSASPSPCSAAHWARSRTAPAPGPRPASVSE